MASLDDLREALRYQPETGHLFWLKRADAPNSWNARYAGNRAFTAKSKGGYNVGRFRKQNLYAHRVAWALYYGSWPTQEIDHINGVRSDNRIVNLRAVTSKENSRNSAITKRNKTGVVGVHQSGENRWIASICVDGRNKHIGVYKSKEEARIARQAAEETFCFHPNHGKRAPYA